MFHYAFLCVSNVMSFYYVQTFCNKFYTNTIALYDRLCFFCIQMFGNSISNLNCLVLLCNNTVLVSNRVFMQLPNYRFVNLVLKLDFYLRVFVKNKNKRFKKKGDNIFGNHL